MGTNPLADYPNVRKALYKFYWVIGVVLGAFPVAYAAIAQSVPNWSIVAMAVFGYLGIALGFTAGQNVDEPVEEVIE